MGCIALPSGSPIPCEGFSFDVSFVSGFISFFWTGFKSGFWTVDLIEETAEVFFAAEDAGFKDGFFSIVLAAGFFSEGFMAEFADAFFTGLTFDLAAGFEEDLAGLTVDLTDGFDEVFLTVFTVDLTIFLTEDFLLGLAAGLDTDLLAVFFTCFEAFFAAALLVVSFLMSNTS